MPEISFPEIIIQCYFLRYLNSIQSGIEAHKSCVGLSWGIHLFACRGSLDQPDHSGDWSVSEQLNYVS